MAGGSGMDSPSRIKPVVVRLFIRASFGRVVGGSVTRRVTKGRRLSSLGLAFALVASIVPAILSPLILPAEKALAAPSTSDCAQTVGTPSALTVSVVGNDCLLTFTATTTWTIPSYLSSARVLLVGGGAGGFGDGGGGGGGGGGLENSSATFLPGKSATITVGSGGATASNGGATQIDVTGDSTVDWSASGGNAGYSSKEDFAPLGSIIAKIGRN